MESIKARIVWIVLLHSSSLRVWVFSWMNLAVISSFHICRMALYMMTGSLVWRLEMVNKNDRHVMGVVVMQNVTILEAQTVCWHRIW